MTHGHLPGVFLSYSHRDAEYQQRLVSELKSQDPHQAFTLWDDTHLQPGDPWCQKILAAIAESQIALLLVTGNFLQSRFIAEREVPAMFNARITNGLRVIPVIVSQCQWQDVSWLKGLQALPSSGSIVASSNMVTDSNWVAVASEVRRVTELESLPDLPLMGRMLSRSFPYAPCALLGLRVHQDDPFTIDFLVDPGDSRLTGRLLHDESLKLVRYFLVALTVPEEHMWVNLSPFEPSRIIPDDLGKTEVGRDLLRQDYILKQLTASLLHPETPVGRMFWDRAYSEYNPGDRLDTCTRTWITPKSATVAEGEGGVIITDSSLDVLLEEDYIALDRSLKAEGGDAGSPQVTQARRNGNEMAKLVRQLVLPQIEEEVRIGRHFAVTRQIYSAAILASWFKNKLQQSVLAWAYAEKSRTAGLDVVGNDYAQRVLGAYLEAYKSGVFDFIREDLVEEQIVPRRYFSGGFSGQHLSRQLQAIAQKSAQEQVRRRAKTQPVWVRCKLISTERQSAHRSTKSPLAQGGNPGGIDLTIQAGRELKIESDGSEVNFDITSDVAQMALGDSVVGLRPVILEMYRDALA